MSSIMTNQEWRAGIEQVHAEAGGLLDVTIIDSVTGSALWAAAVLGDHEAASLLQAVAQAAARIKQAPQRMPALCMCCPRPVKRITAATVFGVAVPASPNPSGAVGFVFCDRCGDDRASLLNKAAEGLRRIWPDLRCVEITHPEGGRA
jgi:hypothetical protein